MLKKITESNTNIIIDENSFNTISKDLNIFYNPLMEINRTISILFLRSIEKHFQLKNKLNICLPLCASGVRGIRILKECNNINSVKFNDMSKNAINILIDNLKLNNIDYIQNKEFENNYINNENKVEYRKNKNIVFNMEANKFLHNTFYSDYIDIDPFGSPVKFIDSSLQKLNKNGFLAVTATDTASITGSSKTASMRRYGSHIFNCENKKELSLRVLATHIIKQAAKLDLKLTPIISYTVKHYARIYFKSEPGKKKVDKHLEKINSFYFCNKCRNYSIELNKCNTCQNELMSFGPLYSEKLSDIKLIKIMLSEFELLKKEINNLNFQKEIEFILNNQIEYNSVNLPFGYSISKIIKYKNINFELNKPDGRTPKLDDIINLIKEKGYDAYCVDKKYLLIKTNMPFKEFYELF